MSVECPDDLYEYTAHSQMKRLRGCSINLLFVFLSAFEVVGKLQAGARTVHSHVLYAFYTTGIM